MGDTDLKTEGRVDEAKGRVQQAFGDLTDNEDQQAEGQANESKGNLKQAAGKAGDAIDDLKDSVS